MTPEQKAEFEKLLGALILQCAMTDTQQTYPPLTGFHAKEFAENMEKSVAGSVHATLQEFGHEAVCRSMISRESREKTLDMIHEGIMAEVARTYPLYLVASEMDTFMGVQP